MSVRQPICSVSVEYSDDVKKKNLFKLLIDYLNLIISLLSFKNVEFNLRILTVIEDFQF